MMIPSLPVFSLSLLVSVGFFGSSGVSFAGEAAKLGASDATANDQFGHAVGLSGDIAVVGAWHDDGVNLASGSAYVFERQSGGNWVQLKKILPVDASAGDVFGVVVAVEGDLVIVGANGDDDGGSESGSAYIFERTLGGANNWGQRVKLLAGDAVTQQELGSAVAINSNFAVVGAPGTSSGGTRAGAAYIFARNQGGPNAWGEIKKLTAGDPSANAELGIAVSISGETVVVGAWRDSAGANGAGAVYVFERNQGGSDNWGQVIKITPADPAANNNFGTSVALYGDTLVVGAPAEDHPAAPPGAAYVFGRNVGGANGWGQVRKLTVNNGSSGAKLGRGVAINGDTIVAGAPGESRTGLEAGAAYAFLRNRGGVGNWGLVRELTATDTSAGFHLGGAVSVQGDTALAGAESDPRLAAEAGSVYVFRPVTAGPTLHISNIGGGNVLLSWMTNLPEAFVLERSTLLSPATWNAVANTSPVQVAASGNTAFFRLTPRPVLNIAFVPVGDPGNPNNGGFGSVAGTYQIGKYEVSNDEYTEFLNAVAAADTYNLYNPAMATDPRGGIIRSGSPKTYTYAVKPNMGNKPVNYVSFYDALRFANWLHNGQPKGFQNATTTEAGAYVFTGETTVVPRTAGAKVWLPSENEWYKAAYHDPTKGGGGYWLYPTRSDSTPTPATADSSGNISNPGSNIANYASGASWNGVDGNVTTVGSTGTNSKSFYGAADMGGNIAEWNEALIGNGRGLRGGAWGDFESTMELSLRSSQLPDMENDSVGFRVARF